MSEPLHVTEIKGLVTLSDGSTSEFSLTKDLGWQQWGAVPERLGQTVDLMEALSQAADEHMESRWDHAARPDDDPEPGDRCKDCGDEITWLGPSHYDWEHVAY